MLRNNFYESIGVNQSNSNELPITVAECAEFSLLIYDKNPVTPPGWELFSSLDDPSTGYRGFCYARDLLTKNARLVYVYRGTVLNFENIVGDIQLALGHVPLQFKSVEDLLVEVYLKISELYKPKEYHELLFDLKYIHTGHSLGGILADLGAGMYSPSVTFENPGSKPLIRKMLASKGSSEYAIEEYLKIKKDNCFAYQGGVNIINTCNEQTGRTFRFDKLDYTYKLNFLGVMAFPPSPSYLSNFTYSIDNTIDQHLIENIKKYLMKGNSVTEINNPMGFQAGYIEYVNPENKDYWIGFFEGVWNSDSLLAKAIRLKYENLDEFKTHGFQQLTLLYNELIKNSILQPSDEKLFHPQFNLFSKQGNDQEIEKIINEFTIVEKANKQDSSYTPPCIVM